MRKSLSVIALASIALTGIVASSTPAQTSTGPAPAGNGGPAVRSDFNGDGYADLVVGVPSEDLGAVEDAGLVHVIYGTAGGLVTLGNEIWHQDTVAGEAIQGTAEDGDRFGEQLATGDFNQDGYEDLAVSAPHEDLGTTDFSVGQVHIIYGGSLGLTGTGNELLWQNGELGGSAVKDQAETADRFGLALAVGDFGKTAYEDLAVGVPGENSGGEQEGGAVAIFYSDATGMTAQGNQLFHQDSVKKGVAAKDKVEKDDEFGSELDAGNFGKSGHDDVAVGISQETVAGADDAGAVHVFYGRSTGVTLKGNQFWHQNVSAGGVAVKDSVEEGDIFGYSLTSGNFGKSGQEDLAIGSPADPVAGEDNAGAVNVIYGSKNGLATKGNQVWHSNSPGTPPIQDSAENGDQFGSALASGNFGRSGKDDLAIGVPFETFEPDITFGGAVHVIYGRKKGLNVLGNQLWHQDILNVEDDAEDFDLFGVELTAGGYGKTVEDDLAIGVNGEDVGGDNAAGAVNVLYGSPTALNTTGDQFFTQDTEADSVPIQDQAEVEDHFGSNFNH